MSYALKVNNISKQYDEYHSEFQRVFRWFGCSCKPEVTHKILKDISFSLPKGEAIAIVGENGAGKSTLLKIITGTLQANSGTVEVNGRVSAILELGMGFHPDMTGRENVYHSAGLMGFSKEQIDDVIDKIEEFAEVGEYFDQPVRTYSSGMQVRVAFSVATAYRPEVLIIDEALSVGDIYFQHKSFARIREFQQLGTTLILVSHDRNTIQAICNRVLLLQDGYIIKDGEPEVVMDFYNALIADKQNNTIEQVDTEGKVQTISGNKKAILSEVKLLDKSNKSVEYINISDEVVLDIKIEIQEDIEQIVVGYLIKDKLGQDIFGTNTFYQDKVLYDLKAGEKLEYQFRFDANLGVGSYSISIAAHALENHISENYIWVDKAIVFQVVNSNKKEFVGLTWIEPKVEVKYETK